jgi:hypothetical protein
MCPALRGWPFSRLSTSPVVGRRPLKNPRLRRSLRRHALTNFLGRAIAQVARRRLLTAEARVHGIYVGQSDTGTGSSPSPSVFPCQYHSTVSPYSLIYHLGGGQWTVRDPVPPRRNSNNNQRSGSITRKFNTATTKPVVGHDSESVPSICLAFSQLISLRYKLLPLFSSFDIPIGVFSRVLFLVSIFYGPIHFLFSSPQLYV